MVCVSGRHRVHLASTTSLPENVEKEDDGSGSVITENFQP